MNNRIRKFRNEFIEFQKVLVIKKNLELRLNCKENKNFLYVIDLCEKQEKSQNDLKINK